MLPTVQAPDPAILPRSMPRPLEEGLKGKKDDEMQDKPNIVKMEPNEPREAMPSANTLQAGLQAEKAAILTLEAKILLLQRDVALRKGTMYKLLDDLEREHGVKANL